MFKFTRIFLVPVLLLSGYGLGAESKVRDDVIESGSPTFNEIEIPLIKNNKLSELLGDDRLNADLYLGEFGIYDDNVDLTKTKRQGGGAWANVIGGSFVFTQPDFFELNLKPQFIYVPVGIDQLQNFNANVDFGGKVKINDYITAGVSLGYNYLREYDEDTKKSSRYVAPFVNLKLTDHLGVNLNTKFFDLRNRVEGLDWDDFDAMTFSVAPYWSFETGRLTLTYTHGYKKFKRSERGRVQWDEITIGIEKDLTERITVRGKVGFQSRRFEYDKDFNNVVGSFGIDYKPAEKWTITLSGDRRPYDSSTYSNFEVSDNLIFDSETDAEFGVARNQRMLTNYNVSNQIGLGVTYCPIVPLKLNAKVSGSHIQNADPDYNLMRASVSAVYNINEYWSIGASYILRYQDTDSGYTDNMFTVGMGFAF